MKKSNVNNVYDLNSDLQEQAKDEAAITKKLLSDAENYSENVPSSLEKELTAKLAATQISSKVNPEMQGDSASIPLFSHHKRFIVPFALAASIALMFILYPNMPSAPNVSEPTIAELTPQQNPPANSQVNANQKNEPIAALVLQNEMSALKADIGKLRNQIAAL